jgi:hypothetical protein
MSADQVRVEPLESHGPFSRQVCEEWGGTTGSAIPALHPEQSQACAPESS